MTILAETLGYSRIGKNREIKKALEAFASGKLEADALLQTVPALKNMVKYAKLLRKKPMRVEDNKRQASFGYWQNRLMHQNMLTIGYTAWNGVLTAG